jgi:hypothetical protein
MSSPLLCIDCWLPHELLLPSMTVLMHHGSMGMVAAALRFGLPSLVLPLHFDQFLWVCICFCPAHKPYLGNAQS